MISYEQYLQFSPYFAQKDVEKKEDCLKFFKSFDALPQSVKNLLTSLDTTEKIINAGKTFGLDEFDTEATSLAVRKIATGEIFVGDGANFIANETELSRERAKSLIGLIVNEILAPALDDIKKIQAQKFPEKVTGISEISKPFTPARPTPQKFYEKPDLKIEPEINKNNIVDLRNR